jgi:uncharacterized membrane protein
MSRLSVSTCVEFHQATNDACDPYMPIVVVGALLGGIVVAILSPGIHSLSGKLAVAGSVCYAAVLAISQRTNVRINKQVARWSVQSPPDDRTLIRARWVRFHIVRTLFSLPALACCILACLVGRRYARQKLVRSGNSSLYRTDTQQQPKARQRQGVCRAPKGAERKRKTCCLGVRHNGGCGDRTPASRIWRRPEKRHPNTRALSA